MVIANLLDKNQSHYVKDIVVKTPEWEPFKTSLLAESNFNNNQPLAGHTTNRQEEDDDDSDDPHYETSMDKVFANFTQVKESFDLQRLSELSAQSQIDSQSDLDQVTEPSSAEKVEDLKEE